MKSSVFIGVGVVASKRKKQNKIGWATVQSEVNNYNFDRKSSSI